MSDDRTMPQKLCQNEPRLTLYSALVDWIARRISRFEMKTLAKASATPRATVLAFGIERAR